MSNWQVRKLGDIADVKLSNVDKKINENERKVLLCNYTDVYKNSFINSDKAKSFMVATCNENEFKKFILKKGQVAITKDSETRDDIGVSTYIDEDFDDVVLGYHLSLITPNEEKLNGRFLHYWLNSKQAKKYFENNAGGSGQRCTLPLDIIKSIPLNLPNLTTQHQIASVLSSLDAKIELNNKINAQLEAMAKTIYDYWFVQFDFPNAQGKPYKSSGGKMVYNEELKREIPVSWDVKKLGDYCNVFTGRKDVNETTSNGSYTFFSCSPKTFLSNDYLYDGEAIIVAGNGSYTGRTRYFKGKFDLYQRAYACVIKPELKNNKIAFFYFTMKYVFEPNIIGGTHGSAIPYLIRADIDNFTFAFNKEIVDRVDLMVTPILSKITINETENQQLTQLRDWLLPMLMNGQVTVGEKQYNTQPASLSIAAEGKVEYEKVNS